MLIFGQSGGGAKVSHLLAMPGAQGLYHRAGVMSGSRLTAMTRADAVKPSDQLLQKLGLTRKDIRKLQDLPFTTILSAQNDVEAAERSRGEAPRSFAPVMGASIPDASVHARRAGDVEEHPDGRLDRARRALLSRDALRHDAGTM